MKAQKKAFAQGKGQYVHPYDSDTLTFTWNGKPDGHARYIPHVRRYRRNGNEYASLPALLRAIEVIHAKEQA